MITKEQLLAWAQRHIDAVEVLTRDPARMAEKGNGQFYLEQLIHWGVVLDEIKRDVPMGAA